MSSAQPETESETELEIPSGWDPFDIWRKRVRLIELARVSEERSHPSYASGPGGSSGSGSV